MSLSPSVSSQPRRRVNRDAAHRQQRAAWQRHRLIRAQDPIALVQVVGRAGLDLHGIEPDDRDRSLTVRREEHVGPLEDREAAGDGENQRHRAEEERQTCIPVAELHGATQDAIAREGLQRARDMDAGQLDGGTSTERLRDERERTDRARCPVRVHLPRNALDDASRITPERSLAPPDPAESQDGHGEDDEDACTPRGRPVPREQQRHEQHDHGRGDRGSGPRRLHTLLPGGRKVVQLRCGATRRRDERAGRRAGCHGC